MRKLAIVLCVLAVATSLQAATVGTANMTYEMEINGSLVPGNTVNASDMGSLGVAAGVPFDLQILVKSDGLRLNSTAGGVLQFACDFASSAGGLTPGLSYDQSGPPTPDLDGTGTYLLWGGPGDQDGSGSPPMFTTATNGKTFTGLMAQGEINAGGKLILAQCGQISPLNYGTAAFQVAYGAGVYSLVTTGLMTWDGSTSTTLTLSANSGTAGQIVYQSVGGGANAAYYPATVTGCAISFVGVPEPVTMALLAIGGLGLLTRRNRR